LWRPVVNAHIRNLLPRALTFSEGTGKWVMSLRNQTEIQEVMHKKSSDFIDGAETNAGTGRPIEDANTMLGTIVLAWRSQPWRTYLFSYSTHTTR
jgi:hypothetical protein